MTRMQELDLILRDELSHRRAPMVVPTQRQRRLTYLMEAGRRELAVRECGTDVVAAYERRMQ